MIVARPSIDIGATAQLACLLEVNAPKPGNVSAGVDFDDTTYDDFIASSGAIRQPLGAAGSRPLGETIHLAVQATRAQTSSNTNLGIVLLLAPLARAAALVVADDDGSVGGRGIEPERLRASLEDVLAYSTVDDARQAYAAIRLASPRGLGTVERQDVAEDPTVTLADAMRLAASRDGIAREYATNFRATFEVAAPALEAARRDGLDWNDAIVETFLTLLATYPDTHIARRAGATLADEVSTQAGDTLRAGGVRSTPGRAAIERMDATLQGERNLANPGTTADITTAGIFVVLLGGGWKSTTGGPDATSR